jgi:hypothetical protein
MESSVFLYFSLAGILIELLGALWLAHAAYKSHKSTKESVVHQMHWGLEDEDNYESIEGKMSVALREIASEFEGTAKDQWRAQQIGFALLAFGLALQFIGTVGA